MGAESWADLLANAGDAGQAYELLDAGDYPVFVEKAETKFSKAGNKMYNLTLVVESGPHEKRKLWKSLVISQSSGGLGMFFRQMAALSLDNKFFAANPSDDIITDNLVGKRATAKVVQSTYQDKPKNDVDFLNAPQGPAPVSSGGGGLSGAPAVSAPPVDAAPSAAAAAPATDPWANSTPPSMPGLGQEDPF